MRDVRLRRVKLLPLLAESRGMSLSSLALSASLLPHPPTREKRASQTTDAEMILKKAIPPLGLMASRQEHGGATELIVVAS